MGQSKMLELPGGKHCVNKFISLSLRLLSDSCHFSIVGLRGFFLTSYLKVLVVVHKLCDLNGKEKIWSRLWNDQTIPTYSPHFILFKFSSFCSHLQFLLSFLEWRYFLDVFLPDHRKCCNCTFQPAVCNSFQPVHQVFLSCWAHFLVLRISVKLPLFKINTEFF